MPYLQRDGEQLSLPVGPTSLDSSACVLVGTSAGSRGVAGVAGVPGVAGMEAGTGLAVAMVIDVAPDGASIIRGALGAVRVNGTPLSEPRPLLHGDKIEVGTHVLVFGDDRRAGSTMHLPVTGSPIPERRDSAAGRAAVAGGRLVSLVDGREYEVPERGLVIGRDPVCHVVLTSRDVSRRHATIVLAPGGYLLTDMSANGISVNGERVEGTRLLGRGDLVQVGGEEFRFHADGAPPPRPVLATLEVVNTGPARGQLVEVAAALARIGRGAHNDLVILDESVSDSHAMLQRRDTGWTITDLASTNGTYVQGRRVQGAVPLPDGMDVRFGGAKYIFRSAVAPSASAAATRQMIARPHGGWQPQGSRAAGEQRGSSAAPLARAGRGIPRALWTAALAVAGAILLFILVSR